MRVKVKCFLIEVNSLVDVLRCHELLVPREEIDCKVVQRHQPTRVCLRGKMEYFSVEGNCLIKSPVLPRAACTNKTDAVQRSSKQLTVSLGVKVECFAAPSRSCISQSRSYQEERRVVSGSRARSKRVKVEYLGRGQWPHRGSAFP